MRAAHVSSEGVRREALRIEEVGDCERLLHSELEELHEERAASEAHGEPRAARVDQRQLSLSRASELCGDRTSVRRPHKRLCCRHEARQAGRSAVEAACAVRRESHAPILAAPADCPGRVVARAVVPPIGHDNRFTRLLHAGWHRRTRPCIMSAHVQDGAALALDIMSAGRIRRRTQRPDLATLQQQHRRDPVVVAAQVNLSGAVEAD